MAAYNLSSILKQMTTGARVLENGEPARVSGFWEWELADGRVLGFPFLGTLEPAQISSPWFFLKVGFLKRGTRPGSGFLGTGTHSRFRVPGFPGTEPETDTPNL